MTKNEDLKALLVAATPLIKYLAENHHPHMSVIVTSDSAEMVEGVMTARTDEFIKD